MKSGKKYIIVCLISIFFLLTSGCSLLISSYKKVHFSPRNVGLEYEKVTFINKGGNKLKGWFIKAKDNAPCIIFCEGNGQNRSYYLRFANFLVEAGYNLFLFDYTGFGDSEGWSTEIRFKRFTEDVESAVDYVKTRPDVDNKHIILFGWSMGGGLALYTAAQRQDIEAVLVDSSVYSFVEKFNYALRQKIGKILSFPIAKTIKLFYSKYDPVESIKKIKNVPILFLHGSDDLINYHEIIRLYEAYNGPKHLVIFPHADHMENHLYYKDEYTAQVLNFLNIYIKDKVFSDYIVRWEYTKDSKVIVTIKNLTSIPIPIELRINGSGEEYVNHLMMLTGTNTVEQKTRSKPTSLIITRFYSNIRLIPGGWDFSSPELSRINFNFNNISTKDFLIPYARLATDPENITNYIEAVEKKNSVIFKQNRRYLASAIILANMMSPKSAAIAENLYSFRKQELIDNLQLFNSKMVSHPDILKNLEIIKDEIPWGEKLGNDLIGEEQTIDSMFAMQNITGKITGKSASIAFMNSALLRIMGIQPNNLFAIYLSGSKGHTITCFAIDNDLYIFNNNLLLPGEKISWAKKEMDISGIYNDVFYVNSGLETNFQDKDIEEIKEFMENTFKNFLWKNLRTKKVESVGASINFPMKYGRIPAIETTKKIQKEIFQKSMEFPISQYTYAKYAFQSLLVKKLEVYAMTAKRNYYAKKIFDKFKTQKSFINWMKNNLNSDSIFNDNMRIMMPDEVVVYKTGNQMDRALLLWAFMDQLKIRSWIISTDKEVYLACQDKIIYFIKLKDFKFINKLKGEKITLLFNDSESFSSLTDTNTLNSEISEIWTKL